MKFYHTSKGGVVCSWYDAPNGRKYRSALEAFLACAICYPKSDPWYQARIAELTGHPRKAKKLYKAWREAAAKALS